MIRFIIFDFGGVVITWKDEYAFDEFAKRFRLNRGEVRKYAKIEIDNHVAGRISEKEFWRRVCKKFGVRYGESIGSLLTDLYKKRARINKQILGIARVLKKSGYKTPLLSNTYFGHVKYNKKKKYYAPFSPLFLSCYMGTYKPYRKIYLMVLRKLKAKPEECVFIDDRKNNLLPAKRLGMETINFKNAKYLRRDLRRLDVKV